MPQLRTLGPAAEPEAPAPTPRAPVAVTVAPSRIEGTGAYAGQAIEARRKVGEMRGERVSLKDSHARARAAREASGHVFMVTLSARHALDVSASDSPLRFANHSCAPNLHLKVEQGRVAFYAMRDIAEGEELTADYGETHHQGRLACRCGAPRCRGWL
jgi:histone-lysine N-methyltransferase SETD1